MMRPIYQRDLAVLRAALDLLARDDRAIGENLDRLYEMLLARRLSSIAEELLPVLAEKVTHGPFAGMVYSSETVEGCTIPKLLGCYEQELHPVLDRMKNRGFDKILNIGCAEGYYAIGLAHMFPGAEIHAWDIDPIAQEKVLRNAMVNGVSERVSVEGAFDPEEFDRFVGHSTLVVCDIEGAEFECVDPVRSPALAKFDLIVELHPDENCTAEEFADRFLLTHDTELLQPKAREVGPFEVLNHLAPLDQSLALFERLESTPWCVCWAQGREQH